MNENTARKGAQVTGNIGLFYACFRLSLLGLNVMPTARNTKGVDLIAYNEDCSKMATIQVKTRTAGTGVQICNISDDPEDKLLGNFWIIVLVFKSGKKGSSEVAEVREEFQQARAKLNPIENRLALKFPPALIVPTAHMKAEIKYLRGEENGKTGSRGLVSVDRLNKKDGTKNSKAAWWLNTYSWWPFKEPKNEPHRESWRLAEKHSGKYREAWDRVADYLQASG